MRALLPVYCRPLGYFIIALALFLPFIFLLWGKSDRCQLAVLQGMLQTPDDDGGTDDNLCLDEERE